MHRSAAKFVPRLLNQRDNCIAICQKLLDCVNEDEMFTKRIIPGNKTWVYGYDVEMKNRKVCQVGSNMKLILMVFFLCWRHYPPWIFIRTTAYQWYYLEILIYLRENVRRKGVNCGKKQLMVLPSWQPCMHHCWFVTSVQKWRWLCLPILPICVKDCDTVMLFSLHREDILFCTLVTVFLYMGVTQIKLHSY